MKIDLSQLMQQAQSFQDKLSQLQMELAKKTAVGNAGGGMVTVTASGLGRIVNIEIEPSLMTNNDHEMLRDLICAACNQALDAAKALAENESQSIGAAMGLPGINLPPGFNIG